MGLWGETELLPKAELALMLQNPSTALCVCVCVYERERDGSVILYICIVNVLLKHVCGVV